MPKSLRIVLQVYSCRVCSSVFGDTPADVTTLLDPKVTKSEREKIIRESKEYAEKCEKLPWSGYKFKMGEKVVETRGSEKNKIAKIAQRYVLPGSDAHYNRYDLDVGYTLAMVDEEMLRKATKEDFKKLKIAYM